MRFEETKMLVILAVTLPSLLGFFWWSWRRKQALIARFVGSRLLGGLTVGVSGARQKMRLALLALAVGLLLLALARPQWGFVWEEARQQGLDILVAVDVSRSMLANDVNPSRLDRTKLAAVDLLAAAKTDRLGLIAFAGTAFLQCPLTLDEDAFRQNVNALDVGIIPQGGSSLADAIETAVTAMAGEKNNLKALVVFSDGEDHGGGALEAAEKAAARGLRIFTVGVGTSEGGQLRQRNAKGSDVLVRDAGGNVVLSRLNDELLRQVAARGNGFYLPLRGSQTMDLLYQRGLAPLPKAELSALPIKRFHERFQWPLGLAILILVMEIFFPERRTVPRPSLETASSHADWRKAVALLVALLIPGAALASPGNALRDYQRGRYQDALREYERLKQDRTQDPRLDFNAGAAAYQSGNYEKALEYFGAAATAQDDLPLQQRSFYNLGNTWYRLGEARREPPEKIKAWEQALKNFQGALELAPNDPDARFNHDWVRQRLAELKPPPPPKPSSSPEQKPQPNEDKPSNPPPEPGAPREQSSPPSPERREAAPPEPASQPKDDADSPEPEPSKDGESRPEDRDAPRPSSTQDNRPSDPSGGEQAASAGTPEGQMTPEQARQLLDALRTTERALIFVPPEKARARSRPTKDW